MQQLFTLFMLASSLSVLGQLNAELVGQLDYGVEVNDVWGYVAPDGTEYALVGLIDGVSVVSLADPENPVEVAKAAGQRSLWRDMKTYREYAYVTADQGNMGLTVIDLRQLPDTIAVDTLRYSVPGFERAFVRAHNIYIDTTLGRAFTAGGDRNLNDGGVLIFDLKNDPLEPELLAVGPGTYAHDVYVQDSLMYASEIYRGELAVYDLTRLDSIVNLGRVSTPFAFTHNAWTSADGSVVYTTDERSNASVASYDLSDPEDIRLLDEYRPLTSLNTRTIPHNVHFIDDFLSISHYTDGLRVVDAVDPSNLIEVANYDTWPGPDGGFNGAWGAFPYLPSGLTLVSDRQTGLYVVDVDYVRAARLEGTVTDRATNEPLNDASVVLLDAQANLGLTGADGRYASGVATAGTYRARVSRPGYFADTLEVTLVSGQVVRLDAALIPMIVTELSVTLREQATDSLIPDGFLTLISPDTTRTGATDSLGRVVLQEVPNRDYRVVATAWGRLPTAGPTDDALSLNGQTLLLEAGYADDFLTDLGWTTPLDASRGQWRFAAGDVSGDLGDRAYFTDLLGGPLDTLPIDTNRAVLQSPAFTTVGLGEDARIAFAYLFDDPDTTGTYVLEVLDSTGSQLTVSLASTQGLWVRDTLTIGNLLLGDSLRLQLTVRDTGRVTDGRVAAGFDDFRLLGTQLSSSVSPGAEQFTIAVYPNPASQFFTVEIEALWGRSATLQVYGLDGRLLSTRRYASLPDQVRLGEVLDPGGYILVVRAADGQTVSRVLLKQ